MNIKNIAIAIALMTLGGIGNALADQGENTLPFTLNAEVSQAVVDKNVQIRLYDHNGTKLPSNRLNLNLPQVLDTAGNMMWGTNGQFSGDSIYPQIDPSQIHVLEVYSQDPLFYTGLTTECPAFSLQNGSDSQHVLKGNCAEPKEDQAHLADANQVPDYLLQYINHSEHYYAAFQSRSYTFGLSVEGKSIYVPIVFFAHLPNLGDDLNNYTPGAYTASSSMIVKASWM